jgi:Ca-activated chloride channel family protein
LNESGGRQRISGKFEWWGGVARAIWFLAVVALAVLATCVTAPARAQVIPTPQKLPPTEHMRVRVDLVSVIASVLDPSGKPVPNLPRKDFQLYQDGRKQQIELFERQTNLPLDLALMIDTSLSTYNDLKFERDAAEHFVRQVLRPGDRMSVFTFAYYVNQLSPFTGDISALDGALHRMVTGTGTSLFDAIYLGSHALEKGPPNHRRVLLLVTDAGETTSRSTYDQARDAALRAGAMLYTILIRSVQSDAGRNTGGEHAIDTIIDETGGAMYPVSAPGQFGSTFDRINRELRTQYLLGYYPAPSPQPGSYHTIQLRLRPGVLAPGTGYTLLYRKGYFATEGGQ